MCENQFVRIESPAMKMQDHGPANAHTAMRYLITHKLKQTPLEQHPHHISAAHGRCKPTVRGVHEVARKRRLFSKRSVNVVGESMGVPNCASRNLTSPILAARSNAD